MAGSNGPLTRSNHSQQGGMFWTRRFGPDLPGTAAWTSQAMLGVPFPMSAATGPIAGTASVTLDALTSTATGTLPIVGTASNSLGALTGTLTGALPIVGTASNSLSALTAASTGLLPIVGTTSQTLGALTSTATGLLPIVGIESSTLGALTSTATGVLPIVGTASNTLGVLTSAATGVLPIVGTASNTLDAATLTSTGLLPLVGTASPTLGTLTATSTGTLPIVGIFNKTLDALLGTEAGVLPIVGTASNTLGALTGTLTGALPIVGTSPSNTLGTLTGTLTGYATPLTGVASITLDALTSTSTGVLPIVGTATNTLDALSSTSTGTLPILGTASNTLDALTGTSTAVLSIAGTASISLGSLTSIATGALNNFGALNSTLGAVTSTSTGLLPIVGTATPILGALTSTATGLLPVLGTSPSNTLGALTLSSTSLLPISGTAPISLDALTGSETGVLPLVASASITLDILTSTATGTTSIVGTASNTLGVLTTTATGTTSIVGTASNTLGALSGTFSGALLITGASSISLDALTGSETGVLPLVASASVTLDPLTGTSTGILAIAGTASITLDALACVAQAIASTDTFEIYATAVQLMATYEDTMLAAASIALQTDLSYNAATLLLATFERAAQTGASIQDIITYSVYAGSLLQGDLTQTASVGASVRGQVESTILTAALINYDVIYSINAATQLQATIERAYSTSAAVARETDKTYNADAPLQATIERAHNVATLLIADEYSAYLTAGSLNYLVDYPYMAGAPVQDTIENGYLATTLLQGGTTFSYYADAPIQDTRTNLSNTATQLQGVFDNTYLGGTLLQAILDNTWSAAVQLQAQIERAYNAASSLSQDQNTSYSTATAIVAQVENSYNTATQILASATMVNNAYAAATTLIGTVSLTSMVGTQLRGTLHQEIIGSGPVAYYPLNELSGTTATDVVSGINGTYTGTYTQGVTGADLLTSDTGVSFGGGYIDVPDVGKILNSSPSMTIEFWYKQTSTFTGNAYLISRQAAYDVYLDPYGDLLFDIGGVFGVYGGLSINKWYYFVAVIEGGRLRVYSNTNLKYNTSATVIQNTNDTFIGSRYTGTETFPGVIDEVAFYNRALTTDEMAAHYESSGRTNKREIIVGGVAIGARTNSYATALPIIGAVSQNYFAGTLLLPATGQTILPYTTDFPVQGTITGTYASTGAVGANYVNAVKEDGPGVYWRFGESAGSLITYDEMGHVDLNVSGGATLGVSSVISTDLTNTAINFNGQDYATYVGVSAGSMRPEIFGNTQITIEAWVRWDDVQADETNYYYILHNAVTPSWDENFGLYFVSNSYYYGTPYLGFSFSTDDRNFDSIFGAFAPTNNVPYHIVGTYDGSTVNLYVNSQLIATGSRTGSMFISTANEIRIGSDIGGGEVIFATIDEVAIYPYALTLDQIKDHTYAGLGNAQFSYSTAALLRDIYATEVMADAPDGYYRFNEVPPTGLNFIVRNWAGAWAMPDLSTNQLFPNSNTQGVPGLVSSSDGLAIHTTSTGVGGYSGAYNYTSTFTIEGWFNWDRTDLPMGLFSRGQYSFEKGFKVKYDSGFLVYGFTTGGVDIEYSTAFTPVVGNTYHVVLTYDKVVGHIKIYVNAVLLADNIESRTPDSQPSTVLQVGNLRDQSAPFKGFIDEVALYPTALSSTRISAHYNAGIITAHAYNVGTSIHRAYEENSYSAGAVIGIDLPSSISGVVLWLDADSIVQADASLVSSWVDASTSHNDVTQSDNPKKPYFYNNIIGGHGAIHFLGHPYLSTLANTSQTNMDSQSFTYFVVYKPERFDTNQTLLLAGAFDGGGRNYLINSSGKQTLHKSNQDLIATGDTTLSNQAYFGSVDYTQGTGRSRFFLNGKEDGGNIVTPLTWSGGDGLYIGSKQNDFWYRGYIAHIIAYNRVLTDTERNTVENYLHQKYSIEYNFGHKEALAGTIIANPQATNTLSYSAGTSLASTYDATYSAAGSAVNIASTITYVSQTTQLNNNLDTSLVLTRPLGTTFGNFLIGVISWRSSSVVVTPPAGWTLIGERNNSDGTGKVGSYYHIAASDDPSTWTWTWTGGSVRSNGAILCYDGVDPYEPIHKYTSNLGSNNPVLSSSITTGVPSTMLVNIAAQPAQATGTPTSGWTERVDIFTTGATNNTTLHIEEKFFSAVGSTGSVSVNMTSNQRWESELIALKPYGTTGFRTYGAATYILGQLTNSYLAGVVIQPVSTESYSAAARLMATFTKTYNASAPIQPPDKPYFAGAAIAFQHTTTYLAAVTLQGQVNKIYQAAAAIAFERTQPYSVGAKVVVDVTKGYSAGAWIGIADKSYSIGTKIVVLIERAYQASSLIQLVATRGYSAGTQLRANLTETYEVSAPIQQTFGKTYNAGTALVTEHDYYYYATAVISGERNRTYFAAGAIEGDSNIQSNEATVPFGLINSNTPTFVPLPTYVLPFYFDTVPYMESEQVPFGELINDATIELKLVNQATIKW